MICTGCMGCRWYVQAIWASHMICSSLLSLRLLYLTRKLTDPKLVTRSRSISKWEQCSHHKNKNNINSPWVSSQHKSGGFLVDFSGISQGFHKQKNGAFCAGDCWCHLYLGSRVACAPRIHVKRGDSHIDPPNGKFGKIQRLKNGLFSGFFCEFPRVQTSRHKRSNLPT